MTDTGTDTELDRIERSIDIDAPADRVWALVQRPGWWINEQEVDANPELREEDGHTVLVHPTYGEFRLRTLEQDEPRYVAFHWVDNVAPEAGTTVEFWIDERPGGVTLRVVESGFSRLRKDRAAIDQQITENTHGWEVELEAARRFVLRSAA
ncbi:ATPase [Nocardioides anomalus]|uniref:ATPase n=1 Tax=Nocardioides anomalus TaxID=2712223 RepID=A0A6G6WBT0_9ACTN|nr:SRPBCC domain-containing protein [Nocardioides anomalus]QIG42684.1 ATPase [Nocardioides anomalus]